MCLVIHVPQKSGPDKCIERMSEVEPVLGVKPIMLKGYPSPPGDSCLCPLDVEATAEAAGYGVESYDAWGDAVLTPKDSGRG